MHVKMISNYFTHHQEELSKELYKQTNQNYSFVETETMKEERIRLGWKHAFDYPFLKKEEVYENVDVLIAGSAKEELIQPYIQKNTLVFRYSERPLKQGNSLLKYLPRFVKWHNRNPKNKNIYLLAASAFAKYDYNQFGLFKDTAYKWGYFPETKQYDLESLLNEKNKKEICWVARFIEWKHPEMAINLAKRLKEEKFDFHLTMIGEGELKEACIQSVKKEGLEDQVSILDSMSSQRVREYMEKAGIFIFTSDKQEGWGAVCNEAMNSGCAVIASHTIGCVPYLIQNNKNGKIFESGNMNALFLETKKCLEDTSIQEQLGKEAYFTIVKEWNAKEASKRLLHLSSEILSGNRYPNIYESGPCSKAENIREDWFKYEY